MRKIIKNRKSWTGDLINWEGRFKNDIMTGCSREGAGACWFASK